MTTTLPTVLVAAIAVGTPVLAFIGASLGPLATRRANQQLDTWRRREETMRMVRWAAEKAVDDNPLIRRIGLAALDALSESELLQDEDRALVEAVADVVLQRPLEAYGETSDPGASRIVADPPREST